MCGLCLQASRILQEIIADAGLGGARSACDGVAATACIHCVLCGVLGLSDSPMYGVAQRGLGRAAYQPL